MSTIAREINGRRFDNLCVAYVVVAGLAAAGTRGISSLDNDEEGERERGGNIISKSSSKTYADEQLWARYR